MERKDDEETKVIYHIDEEDTPYLVKLAKCPSDVTLADFKAVLPAHLHRYKYYFKSQDADFGVVKEEIVDEASSLPLFNGRVVSWLVATEGSVIGSEVERGPGVGQTRPPSFRGGVKCRSGANDEADEGETTTNLDDDSESAITSVSQQQQNMLRSRVANGGRHHRSRHHHSSKHHLPPLPGPGIPAPGPMMLTAETETTTSSMVSSELESSVYETEDNRSDASSRFTTSTDHTSVSRNLAAMRHRPKKRSRRKVPAHLARAGSMSSVTDSTMSLNIITVTLNMDTVNFLGISIVGQSNKDGDGDCGIYVGSIMKGGAVALDGRIEPGDMILQVNDTNFENMSNDDAVKVLKEVVQKPGPIKLVVAKYWDPGPSAKGGYLTMPRAEPVRPIDPGAWVAHTAAVRGLETPLPPPSLLDDPHITGHSRDPLLGDYPGRAPSVTTLSASSIVSSQAETEKYLAAPGLGHRPNQHGQHLAGSHAVDAADLPLSTNSGMHAIVRRMRASDSGLEVKDRTWLKLKISNAFLGSDVVEWLNSNVEGFQDRREARKFAVQMLKSGFIKDTVNKSTFSEQCYYTFGNEPAISEGMGNLKLNESAESAGDNNIRNGAPDSGAIWGVGQQPQTWDMPWAGPGSGGSTTTYGPIYNPAAPPPSAQYGYGNPNSVSSSGSSQPHQAACSRLRLAGSGSGSESASDGRASSIMAGSDKSSLLRGRPVAGQSYPQAVFQSQN